MPATKDYNRRLAIPKVRDSIGGWKVVSSRTDEKVVERYRRYAFTTYVELEGIEEPTSCIQAVKDKIKRKATVLSPYGNPYICMTSIQGCKEKSGKASLIIHGDCRRSKLGKGR